MHKEPYDLLKEAREITEDIKSSLPTGFEMAAVSTRAKIPWKALSWREAIIHRVAELASNSLDLYEDHKFVSSCILIRSLMETTGMIFWLHKRIRKVVNDKQLGDIDNFLMRGFLGAKEDDPKWGALNALSAVDHLNKEVPGFRDMYNGLSEFVHPNWSGTFGSFGRDDQLNFRVEFGSYINDLRWTFALSPLVRSLIHFRKNYNELAEIFPEFIRICEENLNQAST